MNCDRRALEILLEALGALGFVWKSNGGYRLTKTSDAFFVKGKPSYHGLWMLEATFAWNARGRIAEGIKKGMPIGFDASKRDADAIWASDYAPMVVLWPRYIETVKTLWDRIGVSREKMPGLRLLDVACGSGIQGFVLALSDPDAEITCMDLNPAVLQIASRLSEEMGVAGQARFVQGDILNADLGTEEFDIILFGRILYYFKPDQVMDILQRAAKALKPGGLLVIRSYMPNGEEADKMSALVAFQLFIFAPDSRVYTFEEHKDHLERSGFERVDRPDASIITARKPE